MTSSIVLISKRTCRLATLALLVLLPPTRPAEATAPALDGKLPGRVLEAFEAGVFSLPPAPGPLSTSAVVGDWVVPIVRVAFTDSALIHPGALLEHSLFDTTGSTPSGSFAEYYTWASGGRLRVRGRVVATVALTHDRFYYSFESYGLATLGTPNNAAGLVAEAVRAADPSVDWSEFDRDHDGYVDMVWIVHAGPGAETTARPRDMWSITSQLSSGWSNSGPITTDDFQPGSQLLRMRVDRFTMLPELSGLHAGQLAEIGIFCHEFGHALGLPDLYDTSSLGGAANSGPGVWSLMATGTYGADGRSPERPTHLGAWPLVYLGWAERQRVTADTTIQLRPVSAGGPVLEFWCNGEPSSEHYLLEHRERSGFDRDLPGSGILVVHVDETLVGLRMGSNRVNVGPVPALRVIEGDGDQDLMQGLNRGDANDPVPGALGVRQLDDASVPALRSLTGNTTNLTMRNMVPWPGYTSVDLRVTALGWAPSRGFPADAGSPQSTLSPATRFVRGSNGIDHLVGTEIRGGVARALIRDFDGNAFGAATLLDDDPAATSEPSLAALPGGDLVAVWTRGPAGASRVVARTRIAGTWQSPVVLSRSGQVTSAPSVSADDAGRVSIVWLGRQPGEESRVWLARFVYTSPFAQPIAISGTTQLPGEPLVVSDRRGTAYVIWSERSVFPAGLYHVRCHPDSAPSAPLKLVNTTGNPQLSFGAAVDTAGALHTVWHVSGLGISEIHWQRRLRSTAPVPRDSIVDARGDGLRDPSISADPEGHVHAVWLRQQDWGREVRYDRWRVGRGWDHQSSPVSASIEGSADRPIVLGHGDEEASVVWVAHVETEPAERSRTRSPAGGLLAAPVVRPMPSRLALAPAPNPAHAGAAFVIAGAVAHERIDVFDALGRRIATTSAGADGRVRIAPSQTASWSAGLYCARNAAGDRSARFVVLR